MGSEDYAESFGFEWNLFSSTQLDYESDLAERRKIYHLRETRPGEQSRVTFNIKTGLTEDDLRGKSVLDVGCGMGRFADVCSQMGAEVVGVDLSTSVLAAQQNVGHRLNVSLIQCDLFNMPFHQESFDIIYSIGVLHHTTDTKLAFMNLLPYLKPGGRICIWVYSRRRWWKGKHPVPGGRLWFMCSDLLRLLTTRLSRQRLLQFCAWRIKLYPLERQFFPLKVLLTILAPASHHPDPEWRLLDTFDWYSPRYQSKHSVDEVVEWFRTAGLTRIESLAVPVSVTATKPRVSVQPPSRGLEIGPINESKLNGRHVYASKVSSQPAGG